ncbi:biogenesis of lysosome-related organelles complex 1 subunit 6 isoform X3 [Odontomachus brunneus]|uniref:biogenesis of lysosome-related organelles complex 1 subunit 6 isoform X3 n=1 Tax=Odontomachus brunneus TaxID=486640 RepID=UPI0013F20456|nr:biogenesis of lysosome-related organelles complex 1 subunit 6 isoform X3 [Odontomachus brunneus]
MMTDVSETETVEVHSGTEQEECENVIDFTEAVEKLAEGLLSIYQPPLEQVKKDLLELTSKQETLLAQMQSENKKINETFEDIDLNDMKRALRLQQIKQKEALNREQQREQELRREQELIARPVTN